MARLFCIFQILFLFIGLDTLVGQCSNAFTKNIQNGAIKELVTKEQTWQLKNRFDCKLRFESSKDGLGLLMTIVEESPKFTMAASDQVSFFSADGEQKVYNFRENAKLTTSGSTKSYTNTLLVDVEELTWFRDNEILQVSFVNVIEVQSFKYPLTSANQKLFRQIVRCFLEELEPTNSTSSTISKTVENPPPTVANDKNNDNKNAQNFETVTTSETTEDNNATTSNNTFHELLLSPEEAAKKYTLLLEKQLQRITDSNLKNALLNAKLGTIFFEQQQYTTARPYFQKALKIINTSKVGESEKAAIEARLAHVLLNKNQADLAIVYNNNALTNWNSSSASKDQNLLYNTYLNQGKILQDIEPSDKNNVLYETTAKGTSKDWKEALQQRKLTAITHPSIPEKTPNFNLALLSYKQAQDVIPTLHKDVQTDKKIEVLMAIAALYFEAQNYNASKVNYNAALTLIKNNYANNHPKQVEATRMLGELALAQGTYKEALTYLEQTQATLLGNKPFNESIIKELSKSPAAFELVQTITTKGIISSQNKASEDDLKNTLKDYDIAAKLLLELRKAHRNESTNYQLDEATDKISQQAVVIGHQLYQLTKKEDYLQQVFDYAELSKSGAVYEVSQDLKSATGIPKEEIIKENGLKSQLAYLKNQVLEEFKKGDKKNDNRLKELENNISTVHAQLQTLVQQFEQKYPKYHALKYSQKTCSLKELQAALKPNEVFLEYVATDSFIYVLAVSQKELKSQLNILPKLLPLLIKRLQYGLRKNEAHFYEEQGLIIYDNAIGALSSFIKDKNLIIAPDAELYYIPFGVLPTERINMQDGKGYSGVSFFIQQHAICYNHSASAFLLSKNQNLNKSSQAIATWAPHFEGLESILRATGIGEKLAPLPGAEKEAKAIAQLFGYNAYIALDATETNFKRQAGEFNILHLATHGLLNDAEPLFSSLAMTNDADNDGLLYANELYNMQLSANLAVLSACNSGMGKLSKAEGVVGVASGFAYAGVPNLVMSKWPVSDAATMMLMQAFYKNLQTGMPKDVALQQAKIQYINKHKNKEKLLAPFFWGGFVLSGNPDPIEVQVAGTNYWLYGGLLLLVGGGLLFGLKRREKKQTA